MSDSVTDTTIITNTVDFLVDTLTAAIFDPVSSRSTKRPNSTFVSVKHAGVPLLYPCITVQMANVKGSPSLGQQTESHVYTITCEVEVYSQKSIYHADNMAQQVIDTIRTYHYGSGSAVSKNLFSPQIVSIVPVVEEVKFGSGGFEKVHRRVITIQFNYVTGGL